MSKKKFGFWMPNLATPSYFALQQLTEETKLSQWEVMTLGLHMVIEARAKATETVVLKDFLMAVRALTKDMKPGYGKFIDPEAERQTRDENGGL